MKKQIFASGRMELAGNHTDHQNGRVLAGALDSGIFAQFEANGTNFIRIRSAGFNPFEVRITQTGIRTADFGTSGALVRGMVCGFRDLGLNVGGFDAVMKSTLPTGGGLSSSAAFSVLIGRILNELFNDGQVPPVVIARTAQEAENKYFGKPCGLQAQLTIALGKTVYIDFKTGEIEPVKADFASMGLTMCLTETGGSHAGLDTSYARIPADMVYIANIFDKGVLGDVDPEEFRRKGWDPSSRPVRRAMHFFDENERVPKMRDALKNRDGETYMRLMNESGRSSEKLLTNVYTSVTDDTKLTEGLELSAKLLEGKGAWRVHGGGFAGCVQALMPSDYYTYYKQEMDARFGESACRRMKLL